MLILYLIKRMKGRSFRSNEFLNLKKLVAKLRIVLFVLVVGNAFGHNEILVQSLTYNVVRNDAVIGTIQINQYTSGDSIVFKLDSKINAKYILRFNITGKEKSIYMKNVLVYSSVYRLVNNKVKANHNISYSEGQYKLISFDKVRPLNINAISQNLITMYFKEPKDLETIYCDNLGQMVNVKCLGAGKYRVDFEKGQYNVFHYQNGKCVKIEAHSTLFNVVLIPS